MDLRPVIATPQMLHDLNVLSSLSAYLLGPQNHALAYLSPFPFVPQVHQTSLTHSDYGSDESASAFQQKPKETTVAKRIRKKIGELPEQKQDAIRAANRLSAKRHRIQSTSKAASAYKYLFELNAANASLKSSLQDLKETRRELLLQIKQLSRGKLSAS